MKKNHDGFSPGSGAVLFLLTLATALLCVCIGSVNIPLRDTLDVLACVLTGKGVPSGMAGSILLHVRMPRVAAVALTGASLSLCGCAMQGLLRNPLADGSTLGVSSGASLGAVIAIAFGVSVPGLPLAGTMGMAILFALVSMAAILSLSSRLDASLATNTIILVGVIFSMFVSALMSLIIAFAGEKVRTITFWTMGSLSGVGWTQVAVLLVALTAALVVLLHRTQELNAFSVGEDNARHVGVDVRAVKLTVLIAVSVLIGVCVSVGGTIAFVGLVTPHMTRMLVGPNHRRLMPASVFFGAIFLMLADLLARIIVRPVELPIGVVTSLIGAVAFGLIFYSSRKSQ